MVVDPPAAVLGLALLLGEELARSFGGQCGGCRLGNALLGEGVSGFLLGHDFTSTRCNIPAAASWQRHIAISSCIRRHSS